jgi:hypothetical protein
MAWFGKKKNNGPDYTSVNSMAEALRLVELGELVPMLLLPKEFGGQAIAENTVYVPSFVADLKHGTDHDVILPLAADGRVTRYSAQPEYEGKSVVPVAIQISATEPGNFVRDILIWGGALNRS